MNNGLKNSCVYDELYTPELAIKIILPYIPKWVKTIWEPTAHPSSNITKILKCNYNVITTHISNDEDFFKIDKESDMIVTNPPYSLKDQFLERLFELNKPFMLLLPLTSLESKTRSKMFRNHPIQMIIPDMRIDYSGKNNIWFHTSWFCYKCSLKKDLNFIDVQAHLSKSDLIEDYFKKNGNKYLDEVITNIKGFLNIKDRSIKDYLKELNYEPKKRSKTDKVIMDVLDNYKSRGRITVKVITDRYSERAKSYAGINKLTITERTVFNFFKKYPDYKNLINSHNNKVY